MHVYVGTQRSGPGTGLSLAHLDERTGALSTPALAAVADDPAFFVVHPDGRHLYTCNSGTPGGVTAFARDAATGALTTLNHHVSAGRGPSQLSLDRTGRYVLDANYGGGYVEVLALAGDGSLGALTARIEHAGHSVDPVRQTRPYAHCIRTDPGNRYALVADLGLDHVLVYRFDAATGTLALHDPPFAAVRPGSGPRHLIWHPNGRWLYLVEEIANEVTVFDWDAGRGRLSERQTISALPSGFAGDNTSAEVLVHPSGGFVYVSNRGHDSIAVFAVDGRHGTLALVEHVDARGHMPRYMALDPAGAWLIVVNHDSDNAVVFRVEASTGRLVPAGRPVAVPRPYGVAIV